MSIYIYIHLHCLATYVSMQPFIHPIIHYFINYAIIQTSISTQSFRRFIYICILITNSSTPISHVFICVVACLHLCSYRKD